jgi:hypothetical protein
MIGADLAIMGYNYLHFCQPEARPQRISEELIDGVRSGCRRVFRNLKSFPGTSSGRILANPEVIPIHTQVAAEV